MNCIIIDDEPLALSVMNSYCEELGYVNVVGIFTNPLEAIEFLLKQQVDLVFSDIEMPQISGLEFIRTLRSRPLFIFTTAYQKYALDGFELNAVDYLIKPIPFPRFVKAVNRAKEIFELQNEKSKSGKNVNDSIPQAMGSDSFLFVKPEYGNVKIEFDDIKYIQGLKDYLKIHLKEKSNGPILTLMNFKDMESKISSNQFIRVHRSFIVNISCIDAVQRTKIVIDDIRIPIGESYKVEFLKRVGL